MPADAALPAGGGSGTVVGLRGHDGMKPGQHRNWLVTVAEIHLPVILWGALVVALAVGLLSALFQPIYRATSVLSLDSDLAKVLKNVDTAVPTTVQGDFIRSEYFAIHNQAMMRVPQIAEQLIGRLDIRNAAGKRMAPERMVEPGLRSLLFGNAGQGVRVTWISDTQQFAISGFSRDPSRAAEFANSYVQLLLQENVAQFKSTLSSLEVRFKDEIAFLNGAIGGMNEQSRLLRVEHQSIDPEKDVEQITQRRLNVQDQLNTALLAEGTYQLQVEELTRKSVEFEQYRKLQQVVQVNPQLAKLKSNIEDLAIDLASASVSYMPVHPAYQARELKLQTAMNLYAKEAEKTFSQETMAVPGVLDTVLASRLAADMEHVVHQAKIRHYERVLEDHRMRISEMISLASQLDEIDQKRSPLGVALSTSYANLAAVQSAVKSTLPFYRVVSPARVDRAAADDYRYFPNSGIAVTAFIAALLALSFLVLARELHAEALYHGWQLADRDSCAIWADIPTLPGGTMRSAGWESEVAGHARDVFTVVRADRVLRIAGTLPGSGKATVAAALGSYLKSLGETVVMIDADASRRSLSGMRGCAGFPGLAEISRGSLTVAEVLRKEDPSGIALVPAGQAGADSQVDAGAIRGMLAELGASFTRIIVVEAAGSDNQTALGDHLPAHRDIVVARSGWQSVGEVSDAARASGGGPGSPAGVIVNRIPFEADVLSFRGLIRLALHLAASPFRRRG